MTKNKKIKVTFKSKIKSTKVKTKATRVVKPKAKVKVVAKKLTVTKAKTMKPRQKRADITLNAPATAEQKAGIPAVISGDSFEGVKRIDHLPLTEQIDTIFNPLHSITKTTVSDAVSDSTFIVVPTPNTQG